MVKQALHTDFLWELMEQVPDPEIPVINLVELGVVRDVQIQENKVIITITPTYTGCPAKQLFEQLIEEKLKEHQIFDFEIKTQIHPVWTTDWLSEATKDKLMKDGIAPPSLTKEVKCPHCHSLNTKMQSPFGSTPCQSLYICQNCKEPFNYFKCI